MSPSGKASLASRGLNRFCSGPRGAGPSGCRAGLRPSGISRPRMRTQRASDPGSPREDGCRPAPPSRPGDSARTGDPASRPPAGAGTGARTPVARARPAGTRTPVSGGPRRQRRAARRPDAGAGAVTGAGTRRTAAARGLSPSFTLPGGEAGRVGGKTPLPRRAGWDRDGDSRPPCTQARARGVGPDVSVSGRWAPLLPCKGWSRSSLAAWGGMGGFCAKVSRGRLEGREGR